MKSIILSGVLALFACVATAAPSTEKQAGAALFDADAVEILVLNQPFLSDKDRLVLTQVAQGQKYYGAIAFGPDDGLLSDSLVGAFNYHDSATARAAALKGCEAKRTGQAACKIVALVRPKGWQDGRAVSLSSEATTAFASDYLGTAGPKAMAVSPITGQFAIGTGAEAANSALEGCAAASQAGDCTVVLLDE